MTKPTKILETFENPELSRDYTINIHMPEFTCLCPKTGQPDFASFDLYYIPDKLCLELKSIKLYIWSFRDEGHFHEKVTNIIMDDIIKAAQPKSAKLIGNFNIRGGITTSVKIKYKK
jgi:7-cyano-7-deazaguanine reductase